MRMQGKTCDLAALSGLRARAACGRRGMALSHGPAHATQAEGQVMTDEDRIASLEQRIAALEALVQDMAQDMADLAEALAVDDPAPQRTLDGDEAGEERDQDQVL
jgi:hypothetical protein